MRRLSIALLALVVVLLVGTASAQGARSGSLSIHVEAVLGSPVPVSPELDLLTFVGEADYRGVVEADGVAVVGVVADTRRGNQFDPEDALGASALKDTDGDGLPGIVDGFGCRESCFVVGSLFGRGGALSVTTYEPRAGGRLVFDLEFAVAVCRRCAPR
jgi:hypothetical protein